ncbi:MAG: 4Fe-4S binding protein [Clostridia bacterium]|nr:4Fe-4S binding protein [Clostridia bacterium]
MKKWFKENYQSIIIWIFFEIVAIGLYIGTRNLFYLLNFSYIGTCIAIGSYLYGHNVKYARNVVQFAVGLYMLIYLGIISRENMQIEGFWYYLFLGVFEAAVIHYLVAKIIGPILFGRGWCGYACWTGMILDLLPYKTPESNRKRIGWIRYITFLFSLSLVSSLFIFKVDNLENIMFWSFLIGNIVYYVLGILLAFIFKDNRAFCKYICPITIFLKPASYFSLLRVKCDHEKCIKCNKCTKNCPMNVDMLNDSRKRKNGTECILCFKCIKECPKKALKI